MKTPTTSPLLKKNILFSNRFFTHQSVDWKFLIGISLCLGLWGAYQFLTINDPIKSVLMIFIPCLFISLVFMFPKQRVTPFTILLSSILLIGSLIIINQIEFESEIQMRLSQVAWDIWLFFLAAGLLVWAIRQPEKRLWAAAGLFLAMLGYGAVIFFISIPARWQLDILGLFSIFLILIFCSIAFRKIQKQFKFQDSAPRASAQTILSRCLNILRMPRTIKWLIFSAISLTVMVMILKSAWIAEDAYITFRTIENWMHGYGLRWNIAERVQTYTHPLWMLALSGLRLFTGDLYYSSIGLGILCTLSALAIIYFKIAKSRYGSLLAIMLLTFSKAFMDYTTSGLENSLTYLILTAFYYYYLRKENNPRRLLILTIFLSTGILTRHDNLLLMIFPWLDAAWENVRNSWRKALLSGLLGFLPFIVWEIFSLVYYGFPFPNTAYAKLNNHFPLNILVAQGAAYFSNSFRNDPVTFITIGVSFVLAIFGTRSKKAYLALLGILLHMLYILKIGGDYMSGRFLAAPMLVSIMLILSSLRFSILTYFAGLTVILFLSAITPYNPWKNDILSQKLLWCRTAICDERRVTYPITGLLKENYPKIESYALTFFNEWIAAGKKNFETKTPFVVHINMGLMGYYSGPYTHIIDQLALCDPLLARLPAVVGRANIGHFYRNMPEGYLDTLKTGQNQFKDKNLGLFYEKMASITRGPLFSPERWSNILKMNLGMYNGLLDMDYYQYHKSSASKRTFVFAQGQSAYADCVKQGIEEAKRSNWEKAQALWLRSIALEPSRAEARANLGLYYEHVRQYANAVEAYTDAAIIIGEPWRDFCLQMIAKIIKKKQAREAIEQQLIGNRSQRQLASVSGQDEFSQLALKGLQLFNQGRRQDALLAWQKAIKLQPERTELFGNIGLAYELEENLIEAEKYYLMAARQYGKPWRDYYRDILFSIGLEKFKKQQ